MLTKIKLNNYRAIKNSGELNLGKLNIFIGPNNAGKSSLLHAIELFLNGMQRSLDENPLPIESSPSFVSFDSVLRKNWGPTELRPPYFNITYFWKNRSKGVFSAEYQFGQVGEQGITQVKKLIFQKNDEKKVIVKFDHIIKKYRFESPTEKGKAGSTFDIYFRGITPLVPSKDDIIDAFSHRFFSRLEIVNPSRPIPKSIYVLDDPSLAAADRTFLTMMSDLWQSENPEDQALRSTIIQSLKMLNLANYIEVKKKYLHNLIEIKVYPKSRRQALTIADVGFGLSQVLPLVVQNAQLNQGALIVYQPEVHLHPYAQSRLADLFCNSIQRGNQVFVETHSPDLILRLQYLILNKEILSEDVKIFCLQNEIGDTKITNIDFNNQAVPNIPWPKGFLDTSLNTSKEIAQVRLREQHA